MLPKSKRLKTKEIEELFSKGEYIHGSQLSFIVVPSKEVTKYAVVVSKKIAPLSVSRNKLKREIIKLLLKTDPKIKKGSYKIICRLKTNQLNPIVLQKDLHKLLKHLK